jgi:hypothetical protein
MNKTTASNVARISTLPPPSRTTSRPPPPVLVRAVTAVTGALDRVRRALTPAPLQLLQLTSSSFFVSNAVLTVVKLGVAEALADGPRTVADLATTVGAHPGALRRLIRALVSVGIFAEVDGRIALTPTSRYLLPDTAGSMLPLLRFAGEDWHYRVWGGLTESVRTGEPASTKVLGKPLFEYLSEHPEENLVFNEAMRSFSAQVANAVLDGYDLSFAKKLVDVGGGHGQFVAMALERHAGLSGTVFDQPHVVPGATSLLEAAGLGARADVAAGDFFTGEVPRGGDVYTLMNIVHDWSDEDAVRILSRCRASMAPGSRLLLVEMVIPRDGSPYFGTLFDLEMLLLFGGGRERTEDELRELCLRAGLRVERVVPTMSASFVLEVLPV